MNMFLLSRYLLKNAALTTLFICLVLTMIIWLTQTLRLLDFVINGGAPFSLFGAMLFLSIPRFFEIILPLGLALGILYALHRFSTDSELVVMQNSGLGPVRLGRSLLVFSGLVAVFLFLVSGWLTPMANREMDRLRNVVRSDYSLGLLRPGIFNLVGNDTTVYIARRTNLQDLKGVFIHMKKDTEPAVTITAENGGLLTRDGKPLIVVFDGTRQQFNPKTGMVDTLFFERYSLDLSSLTSASGKEQRDADEQTLPELWQSNLLADRRSETENANLSAYQQKINGRMKAEMHSRMSRPLLAIAFALVSLVPYLTGRYSRRGHGMRMLGIVVTLIILQSIHLAASSFAVGSTAGIVLLYLVPVAVIVLFLFLLLNDGDYRRLGAFVTAPQERLI